MQIETMSYEEIMSEIKRLRLGSEQAAARFLVLLRAVEVHREDIWKSAGIDCFEAFLNSHAIVNVARYRNFCAGLEKTGGDAVAAVQLGEGTVSAARHLKEPDPSKIARIGEFVESFETVHGVKPSEQHSASFIRSLEPQEPKVVRTASELTKLRAENARLKAELAQAQRKIGELESKLAKSKPKKQREAHVS